MTPIVRIFKLETATDKLTDFEAVGQDNLTNSIQKESGTLAMYSTRLPEESQTHYVLEVYQDQTAYETHVASDHFARFVAFAKDGLTGREVYETKPVLLLEKAQPLFIEDPSDLCVKMAELEIKAEAISDFSAIVTAEMRQSIAVEEGVLVMYAVQLADRPTSWRFFEIYADQAAYQAHRETPHFKDYIERTADMVLDKKLFDLSGLTLVNQGGLDIERDVHD